MAIYTRSSVAIQGGQQWHDVLPALDPASLPALLSTSSTSVRLENTDHTITEVVGTGFGVNAFGLPTGTVTGLRRLGSDGTTSLEGVAGLNQGALQFLLNLGDLSQLFAGNDRATGGALGDDIAGFGGNDILNGGAGADTMNGGAGNDTFFVDNALDQTVEAGGGGNDRVNASVSYALAIGQEIETLSTTNVEGTAAINLTGNEFANTLIGNAGSNALNGGDGNDTLIGWTGADTLNGGAGIDTANYTASKIGTTAAGVTVDLLAGTGAGGHAEGDVLTGIENLIGSAADDSLTGDNGINVLNGGAGNDMLSGLGDNDKLFGGDGNDILKGGAGADVLNGGGGTDAASYAGSDAGVTVNLATGKGSGGDAAGDTLTGIELLHGSARADTLTGNAGDNWLSGGEGADVLTGGAGSDALYGDDGNDVLRGGLGGDTLNGGAGIDTASYAGSDAGVTVNLASPGPASGGHAMGDTFTSIENVIGSGHNDTLSGDGLNNVLNGGIGSDILTGAAGGDAFVFNTALGAANVDQITDFSVVDDTIRLENAVFAELSTGVLSAALFHTGTAAGDADDRIVYDSATGALYYDADGVNGAGQVQFATLTTHPAGVTNADFFVT